MDNYPSDLDIANAADKKSIDDIAKSLDISSKDLIKFGDDKAKISSSLIESLEKKENGKLILVTAISPTPAGEGKTTTSVGLVDGLCHIGKKAMICLREPSLGPCFGMKGGAAGGGYAQVIPMTDINLHFTGDFHAIGATHNLLSALIDNHIHWDNELNIDSRRITWKRVVDMNDRSLRDITCGLGGTGNGIPRQSGFDITVASEIMAVFCLASDIDDLQKRIGNIVIGYTKSNEPVRAHQLNADGAITALLKDAFRPNLVQTLENNPAFMHGGPFANIAHGCNSVVSTKTALKLADYVVTEAGFGADLGAEKFFDIKCRKSGLKPDVVVLVATTKALKMHGGVKKDDLGKENTEAVIKGCENLGKHIENISKFGIPVIVGSSIMACFTVLTLLLGLNKILKVLGFIGPVIIILTITIAVASLFYDSIGINEGVKLTSSLNILKASENWLFSAILYSVFSLPGLYGFLPLVGRSLKSNFEVIGISFFGPLFFIGAMTVVVVALIGNIDLLFNKEVPILILATKAIPIYGSIFALVIFMGIYTTVTPLIWTVCRRFFEERTENFNLLSISLTLICLLGGNLLPFGQLINLIYPSIGYVGLILIICLILKDLNFQKKIENT